MSEVEKIEPEQNQNTAIIQVIDRAANNPEVDVDKMERLLAMQERILDRQSESQFNSAMTRAQSRMTRIQADAANSQTNSSYATYAALDKALRPIYVEEGFSLSFDTGEGAPENWIRIVCHTSHDAGHSREYHVDLPADGLGAKGNPVMTKTHASGSAMSYGMRYLLKMIFNVAIGEDDDDGNGADAAEREKMLADMRHKYAAQKVAVILKHWDSIKAIKDGLAGWQAGSSDAKDMLYLASESYWELDNSEKTELWVAPTKGGVFTTKERELIKSEDFRKAYYGEGDKTKGDNNE